MKLTYKFTTFLWWRKKWSKNKKVSAAYLNNLSGKQNVSPVCTCTCVSIPVSSLNPHTCSINIPSVVCWAEFFGDVEKLGCQQQPKKIEHPVAQVDLYTPGVFMDSHFNLVQALQAVHSLCSKTILCCGLKHGLADMLKLLTLA